MNPISEHSEPRNLKRSKFKRIVLTGADGQLGKTLTALWTGSVLARTSTLTALSRQQLDITEPDSVSKALGESKPDLIINAAAYTAVDGAENDRDAAFAVNQQGAENLAAWASQSAAWLIHISTDFVFDGSADSPYKENAATGPLGVYGESKLAGEQALQKLLPEFSCIIRTSWLYSEHGKNFVKTMLSLMADREQLGIVADQIGSPTSTHSLAKLIFAIIQQGPQAGVFHWCDGGEMSWFDFAEEIQQQGRAAGLLEIAAKLNAITTEEFPTPAARPAYSVLNREKAVRAFSTEPVQQSDLQEWQQQLATVIAALKAQ